MNNTSIVTSPVVYPVAGANLAVKAAEIKARTAVDQSNSCSNVAAYAARFAAETAADSVNAAAAARDAVIEYLDAVTWAATVEEAEYEKTRYSNSPR